MSDAGADAEYRNPPPNPVDASNVSTTEIQALKRGLDALRASIDGRSGELGLKLDTALEALQLIHDDDPGTRRGLRALRAEPHYEEAFTTADPLVSVVIPTWNRIDTLIERAIPSALAQTHSNIEVIVVGDASPPATGAAIAAINDRRVTFHNLTLRGPYGDDPSAAWLAYGTPGLNAGMILAHGLWIAPLGDDDAFVPDHVERLLAEARDRRLEFVYGRIRQTSSDGSVTLLGEFPPRVAQIGLQAALFHSGLCFMELELGHALFGKANDWGFVHRMMRVGVRMGMVDEVSVDYYPSPIASSRLAEAAVRTVAHSPDHDSAAWLQAHAAELEHQLARERERSGALDAEIDSLTNQLEELRRSHSWRLTAPLRRLKARI